MTDSRKADFYLGCLDASVFLDFNYTTNRIQLCRISFDRYGCCTLDNHAKGLDERSSKAFMEEISKDNLDQQKITELVLKLIQLNKDHLWNDALEEYNFL